jgi:transposase
MYPLDRRTLVHYAYSVFSSLRKTALVLQVSHTTVSRWLKNHTRLPYPSNRRGSYKALKVVDTIKLAIHTDPFVSLWSLKTIVKAALGIEVSRELLRVSLKKNGFSKKKARFFSKPKNLEDKTNEFIQARDRFLASKHRIVSLDETSFGRHGRLTKGYSPVGQPLLIQSLQPRVTTTSCLVIVSDSKIIKRTETHGSFNTEKFVSFLNDLDMPLGTVILLDNVSFHHSKDAVKVAKDKGWNLLFVPPYSPWFNPVEGVFSIAKRDYYKHGSIDKAFEAVTCNHIQAFFKASLSTKGNSNDSKVT